MQPPATALINQPPSAMRPQAPAAALRRQYRMLALVWIGVLAAFVVMLAGLRARENQLDFSHYYASALALRQGLNPYTADQQPLANQAGLDLAGINRADYPPTFLLCFEPLTRFPPVVAYWIWIGFSVGALGAVLVMLLAPIARQDPLTAWLLAALALTYPPVRDHFEYAQCQILILLTIVLAARWMEKGRDASAGMMLALATLLRVFPLLLAGYLIVRRRWRALGYMALGLVIGSAVTFALVGADRSLSFAGRLGFLTANIWVYRYANIALGSFVSRLFGYGFGVPLSARLELVRAIVVGLSRLSLLAMTAWATRSQAGAYDSNRRALSLWMVAMILLSPTAWFHYLVLLLLPFIEVVSAARIGRASRRAAAMAAASFALTLAATILESMVGGGLGPVAEAALEETRFVALAMAYLSAWWFVRDGAGAGLAAPHFHPVSPRYASAPRAAGAIS
jgi:hypothetical protein